MNFRVFLTFWPRNAWSPGYTSLTTPVLALVIGRFNRSLTWNLPEFRAALFLTTNLLPPTLVTYRALRLPVAAAAAVPRTRNVPSTTLAFLIRRFGDFSVSTSMTDPALTTQLR